MLPLTNYYISSPSISDRNITNNEGYNRRKKKRPMSNSDGVEVGGGSDNLAVVKAAAWAWYLRKEGKPIMREFHVTRAPRTPKPSRYKIEATKNIILSENKLLAENRVSKSSLWYMNSTFREDQETQYSRLLDTYEIKNISTDDYWSSSNVLWHNEDYGSSSRTKNEKGFMKKVKKRSLWKGMIVMGQGSTVCGRSDDVAYQAGRRTVKVAAMAEALVRSTTASGGKSRESGRRYL